MIEGQRDLTPDMLTELSGDTVALVTFFYADFPDGPVRIWTGIGTLEWDGEDWLGVGSYISTSAITESADTAIKTIDVALSGLDPSLITALDTEYHQREGKMFLGLVGASGIIGDPYLLFHGRLDSDEVTIQKSNNDGVGNATVKLVVTDFLGDLLRPRIWRYTHEDQQALYPDDGDLFLEYVPQLQNLQLNWGKPANAAQQGGQRGVYKS